MAFIPKPQMRVGALVELTSEQSTRRGRFTRGHQLTVIQMDNSQFGSTTLMDEDGNELALDNRDPYQPIKVIG